MMRQSPSRRFAAAPLLAAALLLFCSAAPLPPPLAGDRPIEEATDNFRTRAAYFDPFVAAPRDIALAFKGPRVAVDSLGNRCQVSLVAEKSQFYLLFSNERKGSFPPYVQGSWSIKRDRATGMFVQAKLFLRSDPGIFARFAPLDNPESGRSSMEVIAYGAVVARDIVLPLPFFSLLQSPLSTIRKLSESSFDWSLVSPDPGLYRSTQAMARAVRKGLPSLTYGDDGAIDADGRNVAIATGAALPAKGKAIVNCSGFVKWIADGIYSKLSGGPLIPVDTAKRKWYDLRGTDISAPYEDSADPYFGLDWVRNLALAIDRAKWPEHPENPLAFDVKIDPFPETTGYGDVLNTHQPYQSYPDFLSEAGYQGRAIKAILYVLALREPGHFYLASVNRELPGIAGVRQHFHVAALFPYFDADGIFHADVFESAAETGIDTFQSRVSEQFVFLVRLRPDASPDLVTAGGLVSLPSPSPAPTPLP